MRQIVGYELSRYSVRFGEREVKGWIPGRDIPKSFEMVAAPRLALRLMGVELGMVDPVSG